MLELVLCGWKIIELLLKLSSLDKLLKLIDLSVLLLLVLLCKNEFVLGMVNTQDVLQLVVRKASAILGRNVIAKAENASASGQPGSGLERLMNFGRNHSDIVNIKNN